MLVFAHHKIQNPDVFWKTAKEVTTNLPQNLKVHGTYPSTDGKLATCLWEADNVQDVQRYLDKHVGGNIAINTCYELNEAEAVGMPTIDHAEHA